MTIDTGGHRSGINDLAFSSDGRFLVSASADKTVRIWDTVTGESIRTLRGQIGPGQEGKLLAAALSPDDRLLALSGWFPDNEIRLVDFESGQIRALLKGHANLVIDLAFSPDGRRLASAGGDQTVRIWDPKTCKQLHILAAHADEVRAVAFAPDGKHLASGSMDGTVRLWDPLTGELLASNTAGGKAGVYAIGFTPNGKHLAVGRSDGDLSLLAARTLAFEQKHYVSNQGIADLAIAPDSRRLLTGTYGAGERAGSNWVLSIPAGRKLVSSSKHRGHVMAVAISPDGSTAATGDAVNGDIYLWDLLTGSVQRKLAGRGDTIWSVGFADDGRTIAWGKVKPAIGKGRLKFSFQLKTADNQFAPELGPVLKAAKGYIREIKALGPWRLKPEGHIGSGGVQAGMYYRNLYVLENGKGRWVLKSQAEHTSFTFAPDGKSVFTGAANGLIRSADHTSGKWLTDYVGHTAAVRALAGSPDGRYLLSGSSDMTIRLWDIATARPLLSIFHGSDNEWVAWTPEGYYTASLHGDEYIGWHINNGPDRAADFYTAHQFERILYRPDYVKAYLKSEGDREKVQTALTGALFDIRNLRQIAPPHITLSAPKYGALAGSRASLQLAITAQALPTQDYSVFVNNIPVLPASQRTLQGSQTKRFAGNIAIPLFDRKNRIRIEAFNGKALGVFETVVYASDPTRKKGHANLHLFAVGVNHFENMPDNDLSFAAADADRIRQFFKQDGRKVFADVFTKTLSDSTDLKPYKQTILDGMNFIQQADVEDTTIIFLASHGISDAAGNYYFVPRDARSSEVDTLAASNTRGLSVTPRGLSSLISWEAFFEALRQIPGRRILVVDTCQAKNIAGTLDVHSLAKRSASSTFGLLVAARGNEASQEYPQGGQGLFTYALLQALANGDLNNDGQITLVEAFEKAAAFVAENRDPRLGTQTPQLIAPPELLETIMAGDE